MTVPIDSDSANIAAVRFTQQGSDPASPTSGGWKLYFKVGGLYYVNSAGTISQLFVNPLTTEGDLLYYHSGAPARLAIGSSGKVLASNGTDPAWATPSADFTGQEVIGTDFKALGLTGTGAGSRFVGSTATGSPVTGTFLVGDYVIAQDGVVWICNTSGSPGAWTGHGGGSVTSIAITAVDRVVTGSPLTSSGTIALAWASQGTAKALMAPAAAAGTPSFRALVASDYPVFLPAGGSAAAGAVPAPATTGGGIIPVKFLGDDADWHYLPAQVGVSAPAEFVVSNSPLSSPGTIGLAWASESTKFFFAAPATASGTPAFRALVASDYPAFIASGASHAAGGVPDPGSSTGTAKFLREDATWQTPAGSATGSVSSVGLTAPAELSVSGSPVTGAGTIGLAWASESTKFFLGAPATASGTPSFRALVASDYPAFIASGATHSAGGVPDPGASTGTTKFLREDATFAVPPGTGLANPMTTTGDIIYSSSGAGAGARLAVGSTGQRLGVASGLPAWEDDVVDVPFLIDGGGSTITTGVKGYLQLNQALTISANTVLCDQSGSIVIDVWKCTYAQFDSGATHPVAGDKITASAPPTVSSTTKSTDSTLTGWTTAIAAGDVLAYNVNSVTTVQRATLVLKCKKAA